MKRLPNEILCGHPDRIHFFKGKCEECYRACEKEDLERKKRRTSKNTACGHYDAKHYAKGRCEKCYRVAISGAQQGRLVTERLSSLISNNPSMELLEQMEREREERWAKQPFALKENSGWRKK